MDISAVLCSVPAHAAAPYKPEMLYLYSIAPNERVLMLAIRLPESIEKRLEKLAQRTGRTKTYCAREAIL